MGIDPAVIVVASGTSPNHMYWFNSKERSKWRLDTAGVETEPWRLDPYKRGLVLTTSYQESVRRSVNVTIFCRLEDGRHYLLISEVNKFYADQQAGKNILKFEGQYRNRPTITIGKSRYTVEKKTLEFQTIKDGTFFVSIRLPTGIEASAGEVIGFDPDLARVYNNLISATVTLPGRAWLGSMSRNCI